MQIAAECQKDNRTVTINRKTEWAQTLEKQKYLVTQDFDEVVGQLKMLQLANQLLFLLQRLLLGVVTGRHQTMLTQPFSFKQCFSQIVDVFVA